MMALGIVGLPNVGKSTLFRALTRIEVVTENYPFCTIDPNIGIVPLRDTRLKRLNELIQPTKCVPATLKVVDIAGLVKGANEGEGLGNKFLGHIREVEAIAHVVRCFDDDNIAHLKGKPEAVTDVEIIENELILADLAQVERKLERLNRQSKGSKDASATLSVYQRVQNHLAEGHRAQSITLSKEEHLVVSELQLLSAKPFFYVANVAEQELKKPGPQYQAIKNFSQSEGHTIIPICAKLESELSELEEEEGRLFMHDLGIEHSGLDQVIFHSYKLLNQITYFTTGTPEVRAWEIQEGSHAASAAGKIHTDFERGFIRAEVYHFSELMELGSENAVKEAGKIRLEGREYVVQDGDIMHFRFNV